MEQRKNQLSTSRFLEVAKQRLPSLNDLSIRFWEPYRISWVGGLLTLTIKRMEEEINDDVHSADEIMSMKSLLKKYRDTLELFKRNNQF